MAGNYDLLLRGRLPKIGTESKLRHGPVECKNTSSFAKRRRCVFIQIERDTYDNVNMTSTKPSWVVTVTERD